MTPYPDWLWGLSWGYLGLAFLSGIIILSDEVRRPQKMFIMNLVWPITALYWGPFALWGYGKAGLRMTKRHHQQEQARRQRAQRHEDLKGGGQEQGGQQGRQEQRQSGGHQPQQTEPPATSQIAVAATHCGAGCTLGDIIGESWTAAMALAFAGGVFQTRIAMDFLLAWTFGVMFQYFTIVPMRGLSPGKGIVAAIRADTLSIVAFQVGLFGWMALVYFVIFTNPHLDAAGPVFWFMMQIGMIIGFFTSYPANAFLLRKGWKERMG